MTNTSPVIARACSQPRTSGGLRKPRRSARSPRQQNSVDAFFHTYIINLPSNTERLQRVSSRLHKLHIPFEVFTGCAADEPATTTPVNSSAHNAAARSHSALLKEAYSHGYDRVLVFEDDVVLRDDTVEWLGRIVPQLDSTRWDVFHLGLHLVEGGDQLTENLYRVKTGYQAHAYVVTRNAIPSLVDSIERSLSRGFRFDTFEHLELIRIYAYPILAIQEPGFSNVFGRETNELHHYFPPFDRQEFMAHCADAAAWPVQNQEDIELVALLKQAADLRHHGNLDRAEKTYRQALALRPENSTALHHLAMLYQQQNRLATAIELMERAAAQGCNSAAFHCDYATVLGRAGRVDDAMAALDKALQLDPCLAGAYHNRGMLLNRMGRKDDALAAWEKAAELNPAFAEPRCFLGLELALRRRVEEGLRYLREAVRLSPNSPACQHNLGIALQEAGDLEGAAAAFKKSVELKPSNGGAVANYANALLEMGRPLEAVQFCEKALSWAIRARWSRLGMGGS